MATITVNVKGEKTGSIIVEAGTTLKQALSKLAGMVATSFTFREGDTAKPVSLDRVLNSDLTITAVSKANGS
jgi:hypothetical protein